jgi:hypothetical protein
VLWQRHAEIGRDGRGIECTTDTEVPAVGDSREDAELAFHATLDRHGRVELTEDEPPHHEDVADRWLPTSCLAAGISGGVPPLRGTPATRSTPPTWAPGVTVSPWDVGP